MGLFRRASLRPAVAPGIPGPRPAPAAARNGCGSRPSLRQPSFSTVLCGLFVRVNRIARVSEAGMLVRNGAVCQRSLSTGNSTKVPSPRRIMGFCAAEMPKDRPRMVTRSRQGARSVLEEKRGCISCMPECTLHIPRIAAPHTPTPYCL